MKKWTGSKCDYSELHYCLLILLKEVHRICVKHNIKYFLESGTLLGAVRHKGFIPWDDDADIGMLREDFEKFKQVCKSEKSEYIIIDQNYQYKLCLKGTVIKYLTDMAPHSVFIDIFPYDKIPDNFLLRKFYSKRAFFCYGLKREKKKINPSARNLKEFIYNLILKMCVIFLPDKNIDSMIDFSLRSYNSKKVKNISKVTGVPASFEININPEYMYKEVMLTRFEDTSFYILKHYDAVLTHMYGDYMTPPPENVDISTIPREQFSYVTRTAHPIEIFDPGCWSNEQQKSGL